MTKPDRITRIMRVGWLPAALLVAGVLACNLPGLAGVTPTALPACEVPPDPLITVVQANWREAFGCPTSASRSTSLAWVPFEKGSMLLNLEDKTITVLYDDGTYERFEDTWQPGDPETDPGIIPPDNLYQPDRSFGKVWREAPGVRERLGWATTPAVTYPGIEQEMLENGTVVTALGNGDLIGLFPFSNEWDGLPVEEIPGYYGGIPATPVAGTLALGTISLLVATGLIVTRRRSQP